MREDDIAVIGMALRFPGANTEDEFWGNLIQRRDTIARFTPEQLKAAGIAPETLADPNYVPARGQLDGSERLNTQLFSWSPREAEVTDPQHRVLLECGWEALESAALNPESFGGPVGVFAAAATNHHRSLVEDLGESVGDIALGIGNEIDFLSNTLSYRLGLNGPSLNVQTACSSSLVALHLAVNSLLQGECDAALAGAVSIRLPQTSGYIYRPSGIFSPDGHCRPFDARAQGTVSSNGAGLVVLMRASEAYRQKFPVRAIIRGTSTNHDGAQKIGFTAPNPGAQAELVAAALDVSELEPQRVSMLEAHGTATALGDSVEVRGLKEAFAGVAERCALGSVKSNLGHLNTAAGMAGLIKTILSLEKAIIPPTAHFESANLELNLAESRFYVPTEAEPWTSETRWAGVSAFGLGGTNAHVVLESAPAPHRQEALQKPRLFVVSGADSGAAVHLAEQVTSESDVDEADLSHTLRNGRRHLGVRRYSTDRKTWQGHTVSEDTPPLAFLLAGVGDHRPGMARDLYDQEPVFRQVLNHCNRILEGGLLDRLYGPGSQNLKPVSFADQILGVQALWEIETTWAHLSLVCVELALVKLLENWGVKANTYVGHSLGEYVAAHLCGVFDLETLLRLVQERAVAVSTLPETSQLAVMASEADVTRHLSDSIKICLLNGPQNTVLGGPKAELESLSESLRADGVASRLVQSGTAFHCSHMTPLAEGLKVSLSASNLREPHTLWLSNVTGDWVDPKDVTQPSYWIRHLTQPVRFAESIPKLTEYTVLEIGPAASIRSCLRQLGVTQVKASLSAEGSARETLLQAVGHLWSIGFGIDLKKIDPEGSACQAPGYPFALEADSSEPQPNASGDRFEQGLAELWKGLLGVNQVQSSDHFMQLGGHSLLALQLVAGIAQNFQRVVSLPELAQHPTLSEQAQLVRRSRLTQESKTRLRFDEEHLYQAFPLTEVQEAYWVGRRSEFGGGVSTHGYAEVISSIRPVLMEKAWNRLLEHHPMLRAVTDESGAQRILSHWEPYQFPFEDLRELSKGERRQKIEEARETSSHAVRSLQEWPWFEIRAYQTEPESYRYHFSFDLLFGDAASWQLVFQQLKSLCEEPERALPEVRISFRDYVLKERELRREDSYLTSLEYWRDRVESLPPAPALPMLNEVKQESFQRLTGRLDKQSWQAFKDAAKTQGLTPSSALLAAFARALAHWSRSRHFTLNLTLFNRQPLHPDVDHLFGDFTSLALLESDLRSVQSFVAGAQSLQEQLWRDLEHRQVTGVTVLRELRRRRYPNSPPGPLMPVVFTSTLTLGEEGEDASVLGRLAQLGELDHAISQTPQVWLDHQVFEREGELVFNWDFDENRFIEGTMAAMFSAYLALLKRLATCQQTWSQEHLDLTPPEQIAKMEEWNSNSREFSSESALVQLWRSARENPSALAVIDASRTLTHLELWSEAQCLAVDLKARGIESGDVVALSLEKGWRQIVAVLGVGLAGGVYAALSPTDPRQSSTLRKLDISHRLTEENWPTLDRTYPLPEAPPGHEPQSLLYLMFTSGSSGEPKAVAVTHHNVVNRVQDVIERFEFSASDRALALTPLYHDLSVIDLFCVLGAGGAVVMPETNKACDPSHWAELCQNHEVSVWNSVPAFMELFLDGNFQASSLKWCLLSGDWIPTSLPKRLRDLHPGTQLVSLGGPTETTVWDICYPVQDTEILGASIPYGRPMVNASYRILDTHGQLCPIGVQGEMHLGGDGVAQGYYKNSTLTSERFFLLESGERIYKSGDAGRWMADGTIEILGRMDRQLKIRGVRIEALEVETALLSHPQIDRASVRGVGRSSESRLEATVWTSEPIAEAKLRAWAAERLPVSHQPSDYLFPSQLILGPTGKPVKSVTQSSSQVAQIIAELLGHESVDPEVNILQLGASSIDMVRLANRLDETFGERPPMDALYEGATASAISRLVGAEQDGNVANSAWSQKYTVLNDPEERAAFKAQNHQLRKLETPGVALPPGKQVSNLRSRSCRSYKLQALSLESLAQWLSCLSLDEGSRAYPSAGGLYPVQTYLAVKKGRVSGLAGGTYYYDPQIHRFQALQEGAVLDPKIYSRLINRPVYNEAALALYFVFDERAIGPMYGSHSRDFALLEAGYMAQLLMMQAPIHGLGMCPIGDLKFTKIRKLFKLEDEHHLVHSLVAGIPDETGKAEQSEEARLLDQISGLSAAEVEAMLRDLNA